MKQSNPARIKLILSALIALNLVACGGGSDTAAVFEAPTLTFTNPQSTYDLANYSRVGRYSLPVGSGTNLLAEEASGVAYNPDTGTLFVVGDGGTSVAQVTKQGVLIDSMTLAADVSKPQGTYFYDPEGITYLGAGKFALVEERYRQVNEFTYVPNSTLSGSGVRQVKLGTTIGNIGIEGISLDPMTNGFIAVKESGPSGVFQTTIDFAAGTASNGSATTENSSNLFDPAKTGLSALNDVFSLSNVLASTAPDYSHLLILSAPDGKVVKMDRSGNILSTLNVGSTAQNEGLTMDRDGHIYVVSEVGGGAGHPEMLVYAPTHSKDAVGLGSNLYLSFSQSVTAGTGNIHLDNGAGDSRTIAVSDTTQVTVKDNMVTINPSADLMAGTTYTVTYPAGLIKDAQGNASPAATGNTFSFTAIGSIDSTAPSLLSSSPADNATDITSSRILLTFNEPVMAGTGNIVISNNAGDIRTLDVQDTTQVTFEGNTANINPSADLLKGHVYNVQLASAVIKDAAGNAFAGIANGTALDFTTANPTALAGPTVLISELNSNAAGGDFFEIYNYGTTAIDLTGWKWDDDSASATDAGAATFTAVSLGAGQRLVVLASATDAVAFNAAWGSPTASLVALGGPGLGKGDAVVLFDAAGKVVAALNYGAAGITASDGTVIATAMPSTGVTYVAGAHAGLAYAGASAATSVVWDGLSTSTPAYKAAELGVMGGVAQTSDATAMGSPGH